MKLCASSPSAVSTAELLVFEQVAVVGQESDAVVHFQLPFPSNWKYRWLLERCWRSRQSLFSSQRISTVCPFV